MCYVEGAASGPNAVPRRLDYRIGLRVYRDRASRIVPRIVSTVSQTAGSPVVPGTQHSAVVGDYSPDGKPRTGAPGRGHTGHVQEHPVDTRPVRHAAPHSPVVRPTSTESRSLPGSPSCHTGHKRHGSTRHATRLSTRPTSDFVRFGPQRDDLDGEPVAVVERVTGRPGQVQRQHVPHVREDVPGVVTVRGAYPRDDMLDPVGV